VCGNFVRLEPSRPPGDAPCPSCGHLLWFGPPKLIDTETVADQGVPSKPRLPAFIVPGAEVQITEGTFASFDGVVRGLDKSSGKVTVTIAILGRTTPVELEYWQLRTA
jgi:hypothetical protein